MSFAVPGALTMFALALPVVLLYILKVRLRRMNVSTNLFWKQIYDEKPPRSIWQYLRHLISLLLQLMLLTLLVLSVADPYSPWQLLQARRIVAVIDNSASMQATDIEPTRFQAAINSAESLVEGLRFRDQMAIVLSGPTPEVVLGMTSHVPTLKRTLQDLAVTDNPTQLLPAIALGKKLIGQHPRGQVVVFTDGCDASQSVATEAETVADPLQLSSDVAALSETDTSGTTNAETPNGEAKNTNVKKIAIDYRIFGERTANIGITQFQVRRSLIDPLGYQILAAVHNASDEPASCRLEIELDGAPVDIVPLGLDPNESWSRSIEKTSLEGGTLVARITKFESEQLTADEAESTDNVDDVTEQTAGVNYLACDDVARAILPGREIQNVLVVTKGNLFLRKVFEANPLVQVSVTPNFPESWPADTIVVFDRLTPDTLPPNDVLVVDPATDCNLWELGDPLLDPIVTEQDEDSPLMKHVRLDNVVMPEARMITVKGKSRTLAGALSKDPVYAEIQRESAGKVLVLTVNLEKSDLAFRTAFPIMVTNALGWFAGTSGELQEATATGATIAFNWTPQAGRTLQLTSPDAAATTVHNSKNASTDENDNSAASSRPELEPESLTLGPFDRSGIWTLHEVPQSVANRETADGSAGHSSEASDAGVQLNSFAVNIANARETDLRPPAELVDRDDSKSLVAGVFARPVWFYLIAACCILSVVEWFLYHRRVIS